jgi:hypothetical protein
MSREYKSKETDRYGNRKIRKDIVLVHLFNEVWRVGKLIRNQGSPSHVVIYGPSNEEFHVYGEKAYELFNRGTGCDYKFYTKADPAKVKIYILTSILDKRENWVFNLGLLPENGSNLKIVYNNGTIRNNIEFNGTWEDTTIQKKYWKDHTIDKTITPIAYKIVPKEITNDFCIDPEEIRKLSDGSVIDFETIRQIALYTNKTHDKSLISKIRPELSYLGLYPEVLKTFDVYPDK